MKVARINLNVDITKINRSFLIKEDSMEEKVEFQKQIEDWMKASTETRGTRPIKKVEYLTASEFFRDIMVQSIHMAHTSGNRQVLKRTKKIVDEFKKASEEKGIATLEFDDYQYMRSSFNKADKWQNKPEIAEVLELVGEALDKAQVEDL